MRQALVLFAKAPVAGEVKTRLAPVLGPQGAADLYLSFVADAVESAMRQSVPFFLYYAPEGSPRILQEAFGQRVELLPQRGDDLGSRMDQAFREIFRRGFESAVLVGTDLPTLPPSHLTAALAALERTPVVLGPSLDGGYYLIGLSSAHSELFERVEWSTPRVLEQTLDRIHRLGLPVELLEPWYDVDTPADLERLVSHLKQQIASGKTDLPHHTADALRRLRQLP